MESYSIGILAGGKSSRFGTDKATFIFQGMSLLGRILANLKDLSPFPQNLVISVRDITQYHRIKKILEQEVEYIECSNTQGQITIPNIKCQLEIDFVFDSQEFIAKKIFSPMIGMALIFEKVKSGFCLVLPCDSPYFQMKIVNDYVEKMNAKQWQPDLLLPHWKNGYFEPLHGFYRVEKFLPLLHKNLLQEKFQLKSLYEHPDTIWLWEIEEEIKDFHDAELSFMNFNELNDFQNIIKTKK